MFLYGREGVQRPRRAGRIGSFRRLLVVTTIGLGWAVSSGAAGGLHLLDAVETTLARDPNIALSRSRLESSRGAHTSAAGQFDPVVAIDSTRSEDASTGREDLVEVSSSVGIVQQLRTGLSIAPGLELTRSSGAGTADNRAMVFFTVRQPLLRGRGRTAVAAGLRSAREEVAASSLDLRFLVSQRLATVVSQYWAVVAAARDLEVLRTTESSSRDLLETTRRLVESDVTPAAELVQLEADLAAKEASRIAGEQTLFAARQDLGREMGLAPEEIAALPLPVDPFPELAPEEAPELESSAELIRAALVRRADLGAAQRRLAASDALLAAAGDELRPRLDLVFTPSYSGQVTGSEVGDYFTTLGEVPGLSTRLGLSLSWPLRNRQAEGSLVQAEAARRQQAQVEELTGKRIGADVVTALDAVGKSARLVEQARRAVRLFERAVENEEKKLRAGSSTLIDVITQRDRLTAARRSQVQARLSLALAIVDLRFQSGTLLADAEPERTEELEPDDVSRDGGAVRYDDLTTVPWEVLR